jgi:hypothetical protein
MCTVYSALQDGLLFRLEQLTSYNWLDQATVDSCHEHMQDQVTTKTEYEQTLVLDQCAINRFILENFGNEIGKVTINARIDAMDDTTVWEFKCVNEITLEHKLQLIIYAWLWQYGSQLIHGKRMFKIINMRTGEVILINHKSPIITEIICLLLRNKYGKDERLSDADFLKSLSVMHD